MSIARKVLKNAAVGVAIADSPEQMSTINRPGCAAVIWRRQPLQNFQSWIEKLNPEQLPRTRTIIRPNAVREALSHACEIAGTPDCPERVLLIDDAAALAHHFAQITHSPYIRLRLDVIDTDACRKFHIDAVTSRLICTYRGTGTQYGVSPDGVEPKRVFTVQTGAPIILRGTLWPEDPPSGLLHRSPPIAGTGETRLLLVVDPLDEIENESEVLILPADNLRKTGSTTLN